MDVQKNKNSEARIRANNKYNNKAYDRINLAVPKGKKEEIVAYAGKLGLSINAFITNLVFAELNQASDEITAEKIDAN